MSGTNQSTVHVSIDRSKLENGIHSDQISVVSNGGNAIVGVNVEKRNPNTAPEVDFTITPAFGFPGTSFALAVTCSDEYTSNENILVSWKWQDDEPFTEWSTIKNGSHTYSTTGIKNIAVQAKDEDGATALRTKSIDVYKNEKPIASFNVTPTSGTLDTDFFVDANGSYADFTSQENLQIRWQWKEGGAFTGWTSTKTAAHKYSTAGNKTITLYVKDERNLTSTTTRMTTVEQSPVTVEVKFLFPVSNVEMLLWSPYNRSINMEEVNSQTFTTSLEGTFREILFNIRYDIPAYGFTDFWIGSGKKYERELIPHRFDPHGLKYADIFINNHKLDYSFTVANSLGNGLDLSVMFNSDNSIAPFYEYGRVNLPIDRRIPTEVAHRGAYRNTTFPASYHTKITGWITALHNGGNTEQSQIIIDYIAIYGRTGNLLVPLARNDYNSFNPQGDGGLYLRYPFFASEDDIKPMAGNVSNEGNLTITPSSDVNRVWHLWSPTAISETGFNFGSNMRSIYRLSLPLIPDAIRS